MALASLGVGIGARGAVGLYHVLKNNLGKPRKTRSGPALLSLPYPVAKEAGDPPAPPSPGEAAAAPPAAVNPPLEQGVLDPPTELKGIPWYGPAMMFGGLGALGLGWKGMDAVLKRRAQKDREAQIEAARHKFHKALLSQFNKPFASAPPTKFAADADELGRQLDRLYDACEKAAADKQAMNLTDLLGAVGNTYGIIGGGAGLLTGAIVYDKMKKRQQRAVLEKALQRRERRRFNQQPTEITAVPEPFHPPEFNPRKELGLLRHPPVDPEPITSLGD